MKINVDRKAFVSALETGGQMAGRNSIPLLETVKFRIEGGRILVTSFNGAVGVSTAVETLTADEGRAVFCVPPERLAKIAGLVEDEAVTLDIDDGLKTMKFIHGGGVLNIPLLPADDYPEFGKGTVTSETSFGKGLLSEWAGTASSFSAADELRPVLNGMLLYSEAGEKGFCASDSRILITDSVRDDGSPDFSVILPGMALGPLHRCFRNTEEVRVKICERSVIFHSGRVSLYSQTVPGKYPKFRNIIPGEDGTAVEMDRKAFISCMKRAMIASDSAMRLLVLSADGGRLSVRSEDPSGGVSSEETCSCSAGHIDRTGLKGDRLLVCAGASEGDRVTVSFVSPSRPVVLAGEREERKILIMPCVIS